jgi:FkbM family methyltransferase
MLTNYDDRTFRLACIGYRNHLENILSQIHQPMIFLDIGANQGIFSLVASKNKYFKQIHAFEPNPNLCKILNQNFLRNKLSRFKIHPYALGKQNSHSFLSTPKGHSGAGKITRKKNTAIKVNCKNRVYLNQQFRSLGLPIFLKIDVEGMEFLVLQEILASVLVKNVKFIFVELSGSTSKKNKTTKLLINNGFKESFRRSRGIDDALFENSKLSLLSQPCSEEEPPF